MLSRAKQMLRDGRLPRLERFASYGGPSGGSACALCADVILPGELEIEVEWFGPEGRASMTMHPRCQGAWHVALAETEPPYSAADSRASSQVQG